MVSLKGVWIIHTVSMVSVGNGNCSSDVRLSFRGPQIYTLQRAKQCFHGTRHVPTQLKFAVHSHRLSKKLTNQAARGRSKRCTKSKKRCIVGWWDSLHFAFGGARVFTLLRLSPPLHQRLRPCRKL